MLKSVLMKSNKSILLYWGENNINPRKFCSSSTKYQNMMKNKCGLLKDLNKKNCQSYLRKMYWERGGIEEFL